MEARSVEIYTTRSGRPAVWEEGGATRNKGEAIIVAREDGAPLVPIYERKKGDLSNDKHALVPVEPGAIIVTARHHRGDFEIYVLRLLDTTTGECSLIASLSEGEAIEHEAGALDRLPGDCVDAAREKAICYHCRETHYTQ